jgi:hypothetical protein
MKSLFTAIFIISPSFVSYPVLSKMQLPFFPPIVLVYEKIGEKKIKLNTFANIIYLNYVVK